MRREEWIGAIGDVWAAEWRRTDLSFVGLEPAIEAAILARAPPRGRLVDIGCGAGTTSLAIAAARPEATVVGLDVSPGLIAIASERGNGIRNLRFAVADVADGVTDASPCDLLFSRHGVMFFDDPVAAFGAIRAGAAPGAPLIFSCFRAMAENAWANETFGTLPGAPPPPAGDAIPPGPFAFADPARVRSILDAAGWSEAAASPVDFTYRAGAGSDPVADALTFFERIGPTAPVLRQALRESREAMIEHLRAACERRRVGDAIDFPAAAWIWTATA